MFIEDYKARFNVAEVTDNQRFGGGLVGYFAYDSVRYVEPSIGPAKDPGALDTPDILLMLSEEVVVFDNLRGTIAFVITVDPADTDAFDNAHRRINELEAQLSNAAPLPPLPTQRGISDADFVSHFDQAGFESAVERIKQYIVAGDVMQVVISQRMSVEFGGDPLNVYRALRYLNPSPYMVFFDLGDHHVVSASPEILARVEQGKITVRPLAGTRKRGASEAEDLALEKDLLADAKEIAEHLMLIDLSRNDSGRVSKVGSITVPKQMFVERYSHVMHIASIVESEMSADKTALDVLKSTLPVGTLSGAPKVRAMEIIDEMEARAPWHLRRRDGLSRMERQHGYGNRHPHRGDQRLTSLCAGRRGCGGRFGAAPRMGRDAQQGARHRSRCAARRRPARAGLARLAPRFAVSLIPQRFIGGERAFARLF